MQNKGKITALNARNNSETQLNGVGGWLLFLVLSLTIFSPLATVRNLVTGYEQSARYFDRLPALVTVYWTDILLSATLTCASVYAGVLLWRICPHAVKTAKSVLPLFIVYDVILILVVALAGLPPRLTGFMIGYLIIGIVRAAVFVAIWQSYLNKSRRVQNTYFRSNYGRESIPTIDFEVPRHA